MIRACVAVRDSSGGPLGRLAEKVAEKKVAENGGKAATCHSRKCMKLVKVALLRCSACWFSCSPGAGGVGAADGLSHRLCGET